MIPSGKCPKCDAKSSQHDFERIELKMKHDRVMLKGLQILCSKCSTILGVQVNPLALEDHLIDRLKKGK